MTSRSKVVALVAAAAVVAASLTLSSPVSAHDTGFHDNCTEFNKKFPHGVGTLKARDKGSSDPVTSFKRSNKIYWAAEDHNYDLDRDNDRVACEKH